MRVIGIGDNVCDKYEHLRLMFPGGQAANFAVYAGMLGAESAYMGVFGRDEVAEHVIATLDELQVEHSRCRQYEGENGYARVTLVDGDRVFLGSNKGGVLKENPLNLDVEDLEYIKTIGYSLQQMKQLFDLVDHPRFKVMIDLTAMSVSGETIQQWFDVFGKENIVHAHFQDCDPYGHYIWGEGKRNLRKDLEDMVKNGYEGYFTQELTAPAYYLDPFRYDKRNVQNLRMYME